MGNHCLNATNTPCWVPQVKDILDSRFQKNLDICPTIWDYYCELIILYKAGQMADSKCVKPCQTSQYKLTKLDREISSSIGVPVTLWFSTNTITYYKEVQVVKIKLYLYTSLCRTFVRIGHGLAYYHRISWRIPGSLPRILMPDNCTSSPS